MDTPVFNAVPISLDFDISDAKVRRVLSSSNQTAHPRPLPQYVTMPQASDKDAEEAEHKDSTDTSEAKLACCVLSEHL